MEELTVRDEKKLQQSFELTTAYMERSYIHELTNFEVMEIPKQLQEISVSKNIRIFHITKLVYDKNEDVNEKLINVFNAAGNLNGSLVLMIDSDGEEVSLYIGVRSKDVLAIQDSMLKSFNGNFPGTKLEIVRNSQMADLLTNVLNGHAVRNHRTVCSVSGVPAFKEIENKEYIQGLEKLIDAMRGEKFSAIFLADSIKMSEAFAIQKGYEDIYSSFAAFQKTDLSVARNESSAIAKGITKGVTDTINDSIAQTQSFTNSETDGTSSSENVNKTVNRLRSTWSGLFGGKTGTSSTVGTTSSSTESFTGGSTKTTGSSTAKSFNETSNTTITEGSTETVQIHTENKSVSELLEKIDVQLDRLKSAKDVGLWNYSCYFLADDEQTAVVAATNYQAIIRGENSSVEGSAVNIWPANHHENSRIKEYLRHFSHPLFDTMKIREMPIVTPGTLINTRELAIAYGLPRKSVSGLPVIEMAEFGRNVTSLSASKNSKTIPLGSIYYMGQEEKSSVNLDLQSLAMHTFITGSTGSGKSNTVYHLLHRLTKETVKFLVIEPAKGEYKNVFGGRRDVHVFGTNPKYSPLLKINPFRFPDNIHVLEHIERLIEIFNACWPMYAAMPAVLRDAVEQVYKESGWKLDTSTHFERVPVYPTMKQLVTILPKVIEQSGYSEEVKSNYVGALVTRVKSLTTGLLGNIFSDDEIENRILFDENCIVDLSRIGSAETKSLLMGIMFMRLQEHRIAYSDGMNLPLRHVTVLEEAHHLLRKTSATQSDEGANLQGKSVEMLTNAIAEMRTYGEGFIIADQSPNLLDDSAIRNTNTKIIMRLPDGNDRKEVGAAAGLSDDQLNEIPKLETGVAIVYQNNWLESVLCHINHFTEERPYAHKNNLKAGQKQQRLETTVVLDFFLNQTEYTVEQAEQIASLIDKNKNLPSFIKEGILSDLCTPKRNVLMDEDHAYILAELINSYINVNDLLNYVQASTNYKEFTDRFMKALGSYVEPRSRLFYLHIIQMLLLYQANKNSSYEDLYQQWYQYMQGERVSI
jgi:hypothetical protein